MKQLQQIHHISAVMRNAQATYDFYRHVLNLRLVKKTVANDDVSKYHLYFALNDKLDSYVSFFERDGHHEKTDGYNCIDAFTLMVLNEKALRYWHNHLKAHDLSVSDIDLIFDYRGFSFVDLNNTIIYIMAQSETNTDDDVSFQRLGPIFVNTVNMDRSNRWFTHHLQFSHTMNFGHQRLYTNDSQPPIHIILTPSKNQPHRQGVGSIDHVAFLVDDLDALQEFYDAFYALGDTHSTILDRMYYHSLYVRNPIQIMFEFTDNKPGFLIDEPLETLGQKLSLPHYLEMFRKEIQASLPLLITN